MWQSNAPAPITTSLDNPNFCAHSILIVPTDCEEVYVSVNNFSVIPSSNGSSDLKKSLGGKPPNSAAHKALWPALQTPLFNFAASLPPVNTKGIQSQCSTKECMFF